MKYKIKSDLLNETKQFIKAIIKQLEESGEIPDVWFGSLDMIADNYNMFLQCREQIKKDGLMILNRFGALEKHPLIKVQTDSQIQLIKMLNEFQLTLKSAQKAGNIENEEESTLSVFLNNKKTGSN